MNRMVRAAVQLVTTGVVAATLAVPAFAGNETPPGQAKKQEPASGYTVTYRDSAGNTVASRSGIGLQIDPGGGGSGCASVDAWRRGSTLFGATAYVFHQVKHWCWSYPRVTSISVGTYVSDVDPNYIVRGTWGHGWYFSWNGSGSGGHYSYRQARIENCVLHYGCIRNEYPWVEIRTYGNGGWSYNTGS